MIKNQLNPLLQKQNLLQAGALKEGVNPEGQVNLMDLIGKGELGQEEAALISNPAKGENFLELLNKQNKILIPAWNSVEVVMLSRFEYQFFFI